MPTKGRRFQKWWMKWIYEFTYAESGADIMDSEIVDYEVLDSR